MGDILKGTQNKGGKQSETLKKNTAGDLMLLAVRSKAVMAAIEEQKAIKSTQAKWLTILNIKENESVDELIEKLKNTAWNKMAKKAKTISIRETNGRVSILWDQMILIKNPKEHGLLTQKPWKGHKVLIFKSKFIKGDLMEEMLKSINEQWKEIAVSDNFGFGLIETKESAMFNGSDRIGDEEVTLATYTEWGRKKIIKKKAKQPNIEEKREQELSNAPLTVSQQPQTLQQTGNTAEDPSKKAQQPPTQQKSKKTANVSSQEATSKRQNQLQPTSTKETPQEGPQNNETDKGVTLTQIQEQQTGITTRRKKQQQPTSDNKTQSTTSQNPNEIIN